MVLIVGIIGGWVVSFYILEIDYEIIWNNVLVIVVGGVIVMFFVGFVFVVVFFVIKFVCMLCSVD